MDSRWQTLFRNEQVYDRPVFWLAGTIYHMVLLLTSPTSPPLQEVLLSCISGVLSKHRGEVSMATLYTEKDMAKILRELRIAPEEGKVDGNEAAKILTWRAKQEYHVEYQYDNTTVRQHVRRGHFPEGTIDTTNPRRNLYKVETVFRLPLAPRRGASRRKQAEVGSES